MFVGCSEISISVIVKHVQHVGIIRPSCLPGRTYQVFQYLGDRTIAGLWFTRDGVNTQADYELGKAELTSVKILIKQVCLLYYP